MRTLLCLVSVTTCILVILCLTNAHPMIEDTTTDASTTVISPSSAAALYNSLVNSSTVSPSATAASTTEAPSAESSVSSESTVSSTILPKTAIGSLSNGSKLVITHIVKTLEFEVAIEEDDNSTESSVDDSSTPLLETDIEVLNPALLQQVVYELSSPHENLDKSIDGTKSLSEEQAYENDDKVN